MDDEWRVEVALSAEGEGLSLGERLRTLDLDDEARERLGGRVVVTRDGARMFLYARSLTIPKHTTWQSLADGATRGRGSVPSVQTTWIQLG